MTDRPYAKSLRLNGREVAEIYGIPPWLISAEYDTGGERWRWRFRHVRGLWRRVRRLCR